MVTKRCVGHYLLLDGHYFIQARLPNDVSTGIKTRVHPLQKEKAKCWYSRTKNKPHRFGFGLWCLTPLSTIFVLYRGGQFMVEETGGPGDNHRPVGSHWEALSYNVVSSTPRGSNKKCTISKLKSEGYQIWFAIFHLYIQDKSFCISSMFNFK